MQPVLKYGRAIRWNQIIKLSTPKQCCHDSSSSKSEEGKDVDKKTDVDEGKKEAKKRMNELLQSITKMKFSSEEKITVSSPITKPIGKKRKIPKETQEVVDFALRKATKSVAEHLGGDAKQTESELLNSLKSHSATKQSLSDLISGMKINKKAPPVDDEKQKPRSGLYKYRRHSGVGQKSIGIHGAPPLGIFTSKEAKESFTDLEEPKYSLLSTWDSCTEREKKAAVISYPRNVYDELVKWTEEGKIWTFPIDNEIGLEEEKSYSFADHIFLEQHLEGWCPPRGPIRHFMELVCTGLSKNPYLTVNRKKAHIEWYKNFFENKKEILKEVQVI